MANDSEHNVCLSIPFSCPELAVLACDVLSVDKELKGSGVQREINTDGVNLVINFHGADFKRLRVSVNAMLKNALLIIKTIEQFENS